jgi:hypothetical protein
LHPVASYSADSAGETSRTQRKKSDSLAVVTGASNRLRRAALEHRGNLTRTRRPRLQLARRKRRSRLRLHREQHPKEALIKSAFRKFNSILTTEITFH